MFLVEHGNGFFLFTAVRANANLHYSRYKVNRLAEMMVIAFGVSPVSAIDQKTVPEELPVSGDPYNETMLELIFPGRAPLFKLDGKKLRLLEPLDRDDENLSHVVFQVIVIGIIIGIVARFLRARSH